MAIGRRRVPSPYVAILLALPVPHGSAISLTGLWQCRCWLITCCKYVVQSLDGLRDSSGWDSAFDNTTTASSINKSITRRHIVCERRSTRHGGCGLAVRNDTLIVRLFHISRDASSWLVTRLSLRLDKSSQPPPVLQYS